MRSFIFMILCMVCIIAAGLLSMAAQGSSGLSGWSLGLAAMAGGFASLAATYAIKETGK